MKGVDCRRRGTNIFGQVAIANVRSFARATVGGSYLQYRAHVGDHRCLFTHRLEWRCDWDRCGFSSGRVHARCRELCRGRCICHVVPSLLGKLTRSIIIRTGPSHPINSRPINKKSAWIPLRGTALDNGCEGSVRCLRPRRSKGKGWEAGKRGKSILWRSRGWLFRGRMRGKC